MSSLGETLVQTKHIAYGQEADSCSSLLEGGDFVASQQNIALHPININQGKMPERTQRNHFDEHRWIRFHTDETPESLALSRFSVTKEAINGLLILCVTPSKQVENHNDPVPDYLQFLDIIEGSALATTMSKHAGLFLPHKLLTSLNLDPAGISTHTIQRNSVGARMLNRHILSLCDNLHRMTKYEAQQLATPTLALIRAIFEQDTPTKPKEQKTATQNPLSGIQKFIDKNLFNEDLCPEMIARDTGHSRASLYRLCEPLGGIQRYIRTRRLNQAFLCLTGDSRPPSSLTNLAYDLGFGSESTFRRAFKETYGMTPKDARKCAAPSEPTTQIL